MKTTEETIEYFLKANKKNFSREGTANILKRKNAISKQENLILSTDINQNERELIKISPHNLRGLLGLMKDIDPAIFEQKRLHKHSFFELVFVYKGGFEQVFRDYSFVQSPQKLVLLNPYVAHTLYTCDLDAIAFNIQIAPEYIEKMANLISDKNHTLFSFLFDAIYGSHQPGYLTFDLTDELETLIVGMIREYVEQRDLYTEMMETDIQKLFIYIARNLQKQVKIFRLSNTYAAIMRMLRCNL